MGEYAIPSEDLDARDLRVAVVVSRFNTDITGALLDGAKAALARHGLPDDALTVASVPGAFELPVVAQRLARSGRYDAVVCLGAVIRGDTPHFDYVAGEAAAGIMRASLLTDVPIVFGVLTTDTRAQAEARIGGAEGHKGEEAATTAVETALLLRRIDADTATAGSVRT